MRTAREKRNEEQTCRVQTDTGTTSDGQTRPDLPSLYEQGVVDEARLPATPTILLVWFGVMLKRKARIVNEAASCLQHARARQLPLAYVEECAAEEI